MNFIYDNFNKCLMNELHCFDGIDVFSNLDYSQPSWKSLYTIDEYKRCTNDQMFFYVFPVNDDWLFLETTKNIEQNFKLFIENKNVIILIGLGFEYFSKDSTGWQSEDTALDFFDKLLKYLNSVGLDNDRVIFVTGNQRITSLNKISDSSNVRIIGWNHFQTQARAQFEGTDLSKFEHIKEKRFLYYNSRFRLKRVFLFKELRKRNVLSNCLYTHRWNGSDTATKDWIKNSLTYDYNFTVTDNDIEEILFEAKNKQGPESFNNDFHVGDQRKLITNHFHRTHMSIISETLSDSESMFITERTYRCLSIGHPFLVFGNPFLLKKLKSYGYKTFEPVFDESYDEETNAQRRLIMVANEVQRLNQLSNSEFENAMNSLNEILEHNKQVFWSHDTNRAMVSLLNKIKKQI